ncbi:MULTISPECIES: aldehyde dehydrogenase family protein [unclassified Frankia]|uniref:aldehyde dehydrogenase family protein n=1 Tax=unclassified Frankia TaxID=2632575 RepID=UPI002AD445FB|nr:MULTISPECIES: aldehyde dehydrogenase family protein [unclassified Frankia]
MISTSDNSSTYPISAETARQLARPLFGHVIDGEVVPAADGATMAVVDPATERQVATAAAGSVADAERAAQSARAAFDDGRWRFLPPLEKERRMRRLSSLLTERADVFAEIDVIDAGLLRFYEGFIVQFAVDGIDYYAGWPSKLSGTIPSVPSDLAVYQHREPIGVVGLITPWNGPTAVFASVAAAISAGNSVVLKPAEQTPMSAVLMAELALEAGIPPGVFNVVQGVGEVVGAALVASADIDALSFTGSVATGCAIQAAAAARVKRVSLELGGKSPFIVFPDANLEAAAAAAMAAVWGASGQVCTAGSRLLVHRSVHDKLVSMIIEGSRDIRLGSGFDPSSQMGPLVSAEQLERVQRYVGYGRDEGAELVLGGERHGDVGYFHQPTVFTSVRNDMRIAREEIFGPVMSVLEFGSEEEAIAIANDTEYGLAAGVWTNDLGLAHRMSRALRTGTVWVNTFQMVYPTVPYGGVKYSGHGRTLGAASLDEFTQLKSVWMKVGA